MSCWAFTFYKLATHLFFSAFDILRIKEAHISLLLNNFLKSTLILIFSEGMSECQEGVNLKKGEPILKQALKQQTMLPSKKVLNVHFLLLLYKIINFSGCQWQICEVKTLTPILMKKIPKISLISVQILLDHLITQRITIMIITTISTKMNIHL